MNAPQWLARMKAYRRLRGGRWVHLADGRWLRTMSKHLKYDTVEWYTEV